ncbi:SPOR domain-containing protein [Leucothrix mucor]|uniref:SPOR domain-containing protein n=1 Tax=Leucothrix mucor TaxID=45248 RepID=UPI0003B52241|nr:SPOR domain-containing protein [Leucothrix mucor]
MNRTTVKRGIGAVILALIAAALLGYLLKDKAAQRKDVVEIAFPGASDGEQTAGNSDRLPELTTDNSSGNVVATAGADAKAAIENTSQSVVDGASDAADKVVASAAATGAAVATTATAATDAAKSAIDFSVRPPAKDTEYLELDLVNNGNTQTAPASTSAATSSAAASSTEVTVVEPAAPAQGKIIASTKAAAPAPQARLIEEKAAPKISSSSTARVITKSRPVSTPAPTSTVVASAEAEVKAPVEAAPAAAPAPAVTREAANGYAIQLLATSSQTRANDLKNVMTGEGYPTYVTKTTQNGKQLFRVRIGQYKTRAAAAAMQNSLKRRYKKNRSVTNSAIVAR